MADTDKSDEPRDFLAITDEEIWEEAKDRLKIFQEAESDNRTRAKEALLFREGKQWDDVPASSVSDDEPELTINLTDAMAERVENNIRQQRPRGKCHPVGDGADVEIAEIFNGIGRHIEMRSDADVAYDEAGSSAVTSGEGYFRMIAEYVNERSFQKDLRILPIMDIFTVAMDPGAIMPSGADQNWCIIHTKMPRTEYRRRYPKADNGVANDFSFNADRADWESKEYIRLAEYFRIQEIPETLYSIKGEGGEDFTKYKSELPRDTETNRIMTKEALEPFLAQRGLRIVGERQSVKRQVQWFRLNGTKVVERQELPGRYIPIFRVIGKAKHIDGKVRRRGMVESMMDPARMVNYGEVAKIKRLGLAPKAPWIAAEGQLDGHPEWTDANLTNYPVLTYKPTVLETSSGPVLLPPPQRQPPAQIEQGFSDFVNGMRSNLMAVAGMPNDPGQDKQGVVVSGRAVDRRQFLSDQSHYHYYDNLTQAIAQCWRVMIDWIPAYYSEPGRVQRVIGEDSTPQMVTLNDKQDDEGISRIKNDLTVGEYDVVMDTGPGYESKRAEGAENLIELLKVPALAEIISKQGSDLVFRSIDHPYMQELADRIVAATPDGLKKVMDGLSGKAKSIVQYLATENAQVKQQLQQTEADLKYKITQTHMQEVVKAHDIETSDATKRLDVLTKAQTARDIEEIRAATKLLDAGAARGHDAAITERTLLHGADEAERSRQFEQQQTQAAQQLAQLSAENGGSNDNSNAGQQ